MIQTTFLAGQVLGAVGGGLAVAFIGVRPALVIDAATFALSALFIGLGTRSRPAAARSETVQPSALARMRDGVRLLFGDQALRTLLLLGWLVAFYTIPEGVAAPYATGLGGGSIAIGLVLASTVFSTMIVTPLFTRLVRPRLRSPDGAAGRAHLRDAGPDGPPPWSWSLARDLLIVGGVRCLPDRGQHRVRRRVPNERRAQAFGIANMGVIVGQGAAFVAAGAAAEVVAPAVVIAVGGGIGAIVGVVLTLRWRHVSPPGGRHAAGRRPVTPTRSSVPLRGPS